MCDVEETFRERCAEPAAMLGQYAAMEMVLRAGEDRVQVLTLENEEGTPVYTHA